MKTLSVELGARGYDILIGPGLLKAAGRLCGAVMPSQRAIILTDAHVESHYLAMVEDALAGEGLMAQSITLPAGEDTKSFDRFEALMTALLDLEPDRKTTLIALGGGVIGDVTGFAASVLLRGVPFIQIPTTLLAQVDSSVGGKTGINTPHGKNLVGSFYQPRLVLADLDTLATLPQRELKAGYAEIVKYGLLGDAAFFGWLEVHGEALLAGDEAARAEAVEICCRMKARIVTEDEREGGKRALLNLGHTFGHALEAETGYGAALLHGEAVAVGLDLAFHFAASEGMCALEEATRVRVHLRETGLLRRIGDIPLTPPGGWDAARLAEHMRHDKKAEEGRLTFVLPRAIGEAEVVKGIDIGRVIAFLEKVLAE